MEINVINYIKNMFAMETTPVWNAGYEGTIFYDKSTRKWISGIYSNLAFNIINDDLDNTFYIDNMYKI